MSIKRRWMLVLCLLAGSFSVLWLTLPAAGQDAEPLIVTINQVDDDAYPQMQLLVSVTDQAGVPIAGLIAADFSLFQDGLQVEPIEATTAAASQQGIAVVLVIDTSGSMNDTGSSGRSSLTIAKEAASSFVDALDMSRDKAAIISFNDTVSIDQLLSDDNVLLNQAIEQLAADGETRMNDATYEAAEIVSMLPPGRKAIVLLTDGRDTDSRLTIDDVQEKAQQSSVPIYTIGLGPDVDPLPLERLATLTGGRYLETSLTEDLITSFQEIGDQLREQYVISSEAVIPADDLRHPVSLRVLNGERAGEDSSSYVARSVPGIVTIETPAAGEEITGQTIISPTFIMSGRINSVSFSVDSEIQETKSNPPFTFLWDTAEVEGRDHELHIQVTDHVGNQAETTTSVTVAGPTSGPSPGPSVLAAFLTQPQDGALIAEPSLLIVESLDSSSAISQVEFLVNGNLLNTVQSPPYETMWDVSGLAPGSYEVAARIIGSQGNQIEDSVQVNVDPSPVLVANLTGLVSAQVYNRPTPLSVIVEHSTYGVDYVEFLDNGIVFATDVEPPYAVLWSVDSTEPGEHTLSARVVDSQGNLLEDTVNVYATLPQASLPWTYILAGGVLLISLLGIVVLLVSRRRSSIPVYWEPYAVGSEIDAAVPGSDGAQGQNSQKGDEALEEKSTQAAPATAVGRTSRKTKPAGAPTAAPPTGILAYIRGKHGSTGQKLDYPLFEGSISLGRGKDVDIMLLDTKVSRHHAEILYKEGDFIFVDSQPTNPSFVNGKAFSGPHVIKDGDEFTMGQTKFVFTREK